MLKILPKLIKGSGESRSTQKISKIPGTVTDKQLRNSKLKNKKNYFIVRKPNFDLRWND